MDKLTSIRIKYNDGTYLDQIPIGVLVQNVGYDSSHNLLQVLGTIDVDSNGTIQAQINKLFNEKVNSSDLDDYVNNQISTNVTQWLAANVTPTGSTVMVDQSLSISGGAADAKAAGNKINELNEKISNVTTRIKSVNLFNPEDAHIGEYIGPTGSVRTNKNQFYVLCPLEGPGIYRFYVNCTLLGYSYVDRVYVYDINKNRLEYITGMHFGSEASGTWYGLYITITEEMINSLGYAYFSIDQHINNFQRLMIVKDIEYPKEYVPYYDYQVINVEVPQNKVYGGTGNSLAEKTALFFGDSICDGVTAQDGLDGWAGRIGRANKMSWYNYGTSGGTFTPTSGHTNIVSTIDTAITQYPTSDYIILEGGTNDADLSEITIGTFDANDYNGTYDTTTFSGAFETAIYKCITYWKHAHVGYIVAQKMGRLQTSLEQRYNYFLRAIEICKKWGVPVLNLWDTSILNPAIQIQYDSSKTSIENIEAKSMYTDGQHLTPYGYEYLTPIIAHWMRGI